VDSGRQIKVISLLLTEIYGEYYYNPPEGLREDDDGKGYEGAIVVDTEKGFYNGPCDQVVLLDFAR
jgi:DNA polymerase elongation subunit (family B)